VSTVWTPTRYSIWDLDNCLFDDSWRTHLIDWHLEGNERYTRYDAKMEHDPVANRDVWRAVTGLSIPIFITGRRERWREITTRMVVERLPVLRDGAPVPFYLPLIMMRPDDCNDCPAELKEKLLLRLFDRGWDVDEFIAAFDDVQSIVDMYRRHGIPATVLRVHDPKATYSDKDL
jgi:hypothetical protein